MNRISIFPIFLKALELFECRRGDPYTSVAVLIKNPIQRTSEHNHSYSHKNAHKTDVNCTKVFNWVATMKT